VDLKIAAIRALDADATRGERAQNIQMLDILVAPKKVL